MADLKKILIVEDSPTQAMHLEEMIADAGRAITSVASAELAFDALRHSLPDLLITDLHLPGMRGDQLCRQLRLHFCFRSIPIIILTADERERAELNSLESGADVFVSKAAGADIIRLRVNALLQGGADDKRADFGHNLSVRRARAFIVDDSPTYRVFLEDQLACEGYEIVRAVSGDEAVAAFREDGFDCTKLDLVVAAARAIDVSRLIEDLRFHSKQHIVTIVLADSVGKECILEAMNAGADDVMEKTGDSAVLNARIRALVRRKLFEEGYRHVLSRMNKELQRSNEELNRFAYATSHDLRAPMRGIKNLANWVVEDCGNALPEESQANLLRLVQRVGMMESMLDAILEYSRVGRIEDSPTLLDTRQIVDDLIAVLAPPKGFVIEAVGELPEIYGSKGALVRVFGNLLSNAVHHHNRPDGRVTVSHALSGDRKEHVFAVSDDGPGIPKDFHEKVFGMFQTLLSKEQQKGSGIGLALVKKTVEVHGGWIEIESNPGQGATFRFGWPAAAVQPGGELAQKRQLSAEGSNPLSDSSCGRL